ncbi:MAG: response regulator transcription factor [Bacteroidetes bacterium]|nr:response regulator transcription factor [Bacteroidota bacterium]
MKTKILLVDDERDIVEFLHYNLIQEGFDVITAFDGEEALSKVKENPDLIILDVMMPKLDGYETCTQIRKIKEHENTPVIFLTAKGGERDEVHALNIGADDFIQKPISPTKLIARVKSNLRKSDGFKGKDEKAAIIKIGPILINRESYKIFVNEVEVVFPKKEFEILSCLSSSPNKVYSREKLLSEIWGEDIYVVERTIDVHVRKIREKLGENADLIETIKGVGYRFKNV